jgi:hypothetical protein
MEKQSIIIESIIPITQTTTKKENKIEKKELEKDVVFLPKNLNFEKLLRKEKSDFKFDIKKAKYIISLIVSNTSNYVKQDNKKQYVQINSTKLCNVIYDYNKYIKYFIENDIVEKGRNYRVGKYFNEYCLSDKYVSRTVAETITGKFLIKNIQCKETKENQSDYSFLEKWYDGLEIDYTSAIQYIEDFENCLVDNMTNYTNSTEQKKIQSWSLNLEKIYNKRYYFNSSPKSKRLFTPLTNLKKDFRKYLTYEGKLLASIDLSCSQPFLLLALLNENFYKENNFNITESVWQKLQKVKNLVEPYINKYFSENDEELVLYRDIVTKGVLYDKMIKLCDKDVNREQIKEVFFTIFYSPNYSTNKNTVKNKEIFKKQFPKIFGLIEILKKHEHNILAIILQSIESEIFLNRISKRITNEKSNVPIFTLHDSIIVVENQKDYVKEIVYDEIFKAIGFEPNLRMEEWGFG